MPSSSDSGDFSPIPPSSSDAPPAAHGVARARGGSSSPDTDSDYDESGSGSDGGGATVQAVSREGGRRRGRTRRMRGRQRPLLSLLQPATFVPAHVPLGTLAALRAAGADSGRAAAVAKAARRARRAAGAGPTRRDNKNRPAEAPSHRPVPKLRQVIQATALERRDPRFDPLVVGRAPARTAAGSRPPAADAAARRYAFLYDETLPAERDALVAQLKRTKAGAARAGLQAALTRASQALAGERERRVLADRVAARRSTERGAVRAGKAPFHPKQADLKRAALASKFEALKARGGLDAHLAKRRKRNAAKDHRWLPGTRRAEG